MGWIQNITIGPRNLFVSLGGWRDLNLFEDWDVWSRANVVGKYAWTPFKFAANETDHPVVRSAYRRMRQRYERYCCRMRLGMKIFTKGEKIGPSQRIANFAARTRVTFQGVFQGQDPAFNSLNPDFYVNLRSAKTQGEGPRPSESSSQA